MGDQTQPRIEIGAKPQSLESADAPPAAGWLVWVRDNGCGIDSAHLREIFGLFNKLERATEGSGIGLALVKRIVGFQGGRIWAESEGVGRGSRFFLTLPAGGCAGREAA